MDWRLMIVYSSVYRPQERFSNEEKRSKTSDESPDKIKAFT